MNPKIAENLTKLLFLVNKKLTSTKSQLFQKAYSPRYHLTSRITFPLKKSNFFIYINDYNFVFFVNLSPPKIIYNDFFKLYS